MGTPLMSLSCKAIMTKQTRKLPQEECCEIRQNSSTRRRIYYYIYASESTDSPWQVHHYILVTEAHFSLSRTDCLNATKRPWHHLPPSRTTWIAGLCRAVLKYLSRLFIPLSWPFKWNRLPLRQNEIENKTQIRNNLLPNRLQELLLWPLTSSHSKCHVSCYMKHHDKAVRQERLPLCWCGFGMIVGFKRQPTTSAATTKPPGQPFGIIQWWMRLLFCGFCIIVFGIFTMAGVYCVGNVRVVLGHGNTIIQEWRSTLSIRSKVLNALITIVTRREFHMTTAVLAIFPLDWCDFKCIGCLWTAECHGQQQDGWLHVWRKSIDSRHNSNYEHFEGKMKWSVVILDNKVG